jgi:hypothetical protein
MTKYGAACLLAYAGALSVIMFWQTDNTVIGVLVIVAAVGWLAWWLERFVMSAPQPAAVSPKTVSHSPKAVSRPTSKVASPPAPVPVPEEKAPVPSNEMADQVRVTLTEAEQAICLSIKEFKHITAEAKEVAQTAREMMNWGSEKSPLIHSALAHLSERSEDISTNAQKLVTTFQFHDLMRQRLESVAAYLDTVPGSGAGSPADATGTGAKTAGGTVLPGAAVNFAPKKNDPADVTMF